MRSLIRAALSCVLAAILVLPTIASAQTALDLAKEGRSLLREGDPAAALAILEDALPALASEYGQQHLYLAFALDDMASAAQALGRLDEALAFVDRAVDVAGAAAGTGSVERAALLGNRGVIRTSLGQLASAEADLTEAREVLLAELGAANARTVAVTRSLATVLDELERHGEAAALARSLLAALVPTGTDTAAIRLDLAGFLIEQDEDAAAQAELDRVAPAPQAREVQARTFELAARLALRRSDPAAADELLDRAARLVEDEAGPVFAQILYARGSLQLLRRQPAEAEASYRRLLDVYAGFLGGDHLAVARALHQLAIAYGDLARPGESSAFFERAIALTRATLGEDSAALAETRTEYAHELREQGEVEAAIREAEAAIAIFDRLAEPRPLRRAFAINARGFAWRAAGRLDAADADLREGIATIAAERGAASSDLPPGLIVRAEIALARDDPTTALAFADQALAIIERLGSGSIATQGRALEVRARALLARGEVEPGLASVRRATEVARSRIDRVLSLRSRAAFDELRAARPIFETHVDALTIADPSGRESELFEILQLPHLTATSASIGNMAQRFAEGAGALAGLVRERQQLAELQAVLERQLSEAIASGSDRRAVVEARLAEVEATLAERDGQLALRFPDYSELTRPQPATLESVQAVLGADEAILLQLTTPERTHLLLVQGDRLRYAATGLTGARLTELVEEVLAAFEEALGRPGLRAPVPLAALHELYLGLIAPFAVELAEVRHLMFVPDGAMQNLSPQVLLASSEADAQPRYLIDDLAISVLPAPSTILALRRVAGASTAPEPFAGFGDPDFGGRGDRLSRAPAIDRILDRGVAVDTAAMRSLLVPLPETRSELQALAGILGSQQSSLFFGPSASEAAVKDKDLKRYRVLAFATHGLLATETAIFGGMAEPSLAFSPPARPTAHDDGLLTASEVAQLDLDADWVLLSACNTASGSGANGAEGLSGLARSFFFAGARSLLVTHWPVVSDGAELLTTGTFRAARDEPALTRAEAFRHSILALRHGTDAMRRHPAYWGPFVLVGEGGG